MCIRDSPHVAHQGLVKVITCDLDGCTYHRTSQGNDGNISSSASDVNDHITAGLAKDVYKRQVIFVRTTSTSTYIIVVHILLLRYLILSIKKRPKLFHSPDYYTIQMWIRQGFLGLFSVWLRMPAGRFLSCTV